MRISEGKPYPLGATADAEGTNFAVFSAHATSVEVCIFDAEGGREIERFELPEYTDEIFHGHVADVGAGTSMASACTALTSPRRDIDSIRTSSCLTPMPAPMPASSCGTPPFSATRWGRRRRFDPG